MVMIDNILILENERDLTHYKSLMHQASIVIMLDSRKAKVIKSRYAKFNHDLSDELVEMLKNGIKFMKDSIEKESEEKFK